MVLIHPTAMKLPNRNRRHLNAKQRVFKLRRSQNGIDINRKESEINNNADTVSDYANNYGNVQNR
jgi:hypothetical protein